MHPLIVAHGLNREGIFFLSKRNNVSALRCFCRALSEIKNCTTGTADETPTPVSLYSETVVWSSFEEGGHHWTTHEAGYFIFGSPLSLQASFLSDPSSQPRAATVLAYCILYNLALTHHLHAVSVQDPHKSWKHMQKAASLYELAHNLHVSEHIPQTYIETMAMINNLGHVFHFLGEIDKADKCSKHLLSCLMVVLDISDHGSDNEIVEGFLGNVLPLIVQSDQPAAAA